MNPAERQIQSYCEKLAAMLESFAEAPAEYVKVYVCALAYFSEDDGAFNSFCKKIGMDFNEAWNAFDYWQSKGLLSVINGGETLKFEFLIKPLQSEIYAQSEYNLMVQKLFGMRTLKANEYARVYDFTDVYGLSKDIALLLLEYCIKKKGVNVSFEYIDKVAQRWSEDGVTTIEQASEKINEQDVQFSGSTKILRYLGIKDRLPSKPEQDLYNRWIKEMGFSHEAVKAACTYTVGAANPTLVYLNGILNNMYKNGVLTAKEIREFNTSTEEESKNIREILRRVGVSTSTIAAEHRKFYRKWTETFGFTQDVLLYAANIAAKNFKTSLTYIDKVLENIKGKGMTSIEDIKRHDKEISALQAKIKDIFKAAGIRKTPTERDRDKYSELRNAGMSHELIVFAAEKSSAAKNPQQYMEKLISAWLLKGVMTVKQATTSFAPQTNESIRYTKEQLDGIGADVTALGDKL